MCDPGNTARCQHREVIKFPELSNSRGGNNISDVKWCFRSKLTTRIHVLISAACVLPNQFLKMFQKHNTRQYNTMAKNKDLSKQHHLYSNVIHRYIYITYKVFVTKMFNLNLMKRKKPERCRMWNSLRDLSKVNCCENSLKKCGEWNSQG